MNDKILASRIAARFQGSKPKPLKTFTNKEDGMEAYVFENPDGGYNVTVKDLESGMFVPSGYVGIRSLQDAAAKAKRLAGL